MSYVATRLSVSSTANGFPYHNTVTYYISVPSFNVIKSQVDDLLEHLSLANDPNDYSRDSFESMFKDSLETYCLDIEEEIKMASK